MFGVGGGGGQIISTFGFITGKTGCGSKEVVWFEVRALVPFLGRGARC